MFIDLFKPVKKVEPELGEAFDTLTSEETGAAVFPLKQYLKYFIFF